MNHRIGAILTASAFVLATPLSAQVQTRPTVTTGIEIQVRRIADTTWTAASTVGIGACVMVRLDPKVDADGGFSVTSFSGFSGVRVKNAEGNWTEISTEDLAQLRSCLPG